MYNSIAAGRRLAVHMVAAQAGAVILAGLLFLAGSTASAMAAWCGGAVAVAGTAVLALRVFAPPLAGGATTLRRFTVGLLLKWLVVLVGLYLILARLRLPPLPALSGFGVAMLVNVWMLRLKR